MKFAYCPNCQTLQPRRFFSNTCAVCFGDLRIVNVPWGIFGWAALISSFIALVIGVVEFLKYDLGLGDYTLYLFLIFAVLTYVFMFFEVGKAEEKAWQLLGKVKPSTER